LVARLAEAKGKVMLRQRKAQEKKESYNPTREDRKFVLGERCWLMDLCWPRLSKKLAGSGKGHTVL